MATLAILPAALSCGSGKEGTGPATPRVASVEIVGSLTAMSVGQTLQLSAAARDSANDAIGGAQITWSTTAPSVATVSPTGLVRGMGVGSATLRASSGSVSASVDLVVRDSAALPRVLSGRIERVNITMSGTYRVNGDLVLIADSALRMHGTLLLAPGASLALWGDELVELSGSIQEDTLVAAATKVNSRTLFAEVPITGTVVIGGKRINVRDHLIAVGCPLAIAGRQAAAPALVIANSSVLPNEGRHGTKAQPNGGPGCDVEIGTLAAQQILTERTQKSTQPFSHLAFLRSLITAGGGGTGFSPLPQDGNDVGNRWEAVAGDGGKGGHLGIASDNLEVRESHLLAGRAGPGGSINVTLRDGSGPNGEGQSLLATTGSAGAAGDLDVAARMVIAADEFREPGLQGPGGAYVSGGNGVAGAPGGKMNVSVGFRSTRGRVSLPAGVPAPMELDALLSFARFLHAGNGGHAVAPQQPGGPAGDIIVEGFFPGSAAHLQQIEVTESFNGGIGYDGCSVKPKKISGTDGGPGGKIRRKTTPLNHNDSFNGGFGGDGHPGQGRGGAEGRDIDAGNLPIGSRGGDGRDCPDYLGLVPPPPSFQHTAGSTVCPQPVGSLVLSSTSAVAVNYSATVTGTSALTLGNATGTLQPGGTTSVPVSFNCSTATSFNATIDVDATPVAGGVTQRLSAPIAGQIAYLAVKLNHALGSYPAGDVIPLSRTGNGRLNAAHLPFCAYNHLHAATPAGIVIASEAGVVSGPHPDPEPGGCGYGEIITVLTQPPAATAKRF